MLVEDGAVLVDVDPVRHRLVVVGDVSVLVIHSVLVLRDNKPYSLRKQCTTMTQKNVMSHVLLHYINIKYVQTYLVLESRLNAVGPIEITSVLGTTWTENCSAMAIAIKQIGLFTNKSRKNKCKTSVCFATGYIHSGEIKIFKTKAKF